MPFTFRKRQRLCPLVFNIGKSGLTSWGIKLGPLTGSTAQACVIT